MSRDRRPDRCRFRNLKKISSNISRTYNIEVVDLVKHPQLAAGDQILAIPTLVRKLRNRCAKLWATSATRNRLSWVNYRPAPRSEYEWKRDTRDRRPVDGRSGQTLRAIRDGAVDRLCAGDRRPSRVHAGRFRPSHSTWWSECNRPSRLTVHCLCHHSLAQLLGFPREAVISFALTDFLAPEDIQLARNCSVMPGAGLARARCASFAQRTSQYPLIFRSLYCRETSRQPES